MIIGVPKEVKEHEYRVALLPSAAYQLIKRGHQVLVQRNAGTGAGYPDSDYQQAGATLLDDHRAIFEQAGLIVKVKEPQQSEYALLRPGQNRCALEIRRDGSCV
jgi:alanine dehydrogenase